MKLPLRQLDRHLTDGLAKVYLVAGDEREAVMRLVAAGPPEEEVGLEPFAPPDYMPTARSGRA